MVVSVVMTLAVAVAAWEIYCRSLGYAPTLNDTGDLWAEARRRVEPESLVIVGDSRALFDLDLDLLEQGLGQRPVQLAQPGSTAYPVLADLINEKSFHGTIICSVVPRLFFAPPGSPPMNRSEKAVRRAHDQTYAQRASHHLGVYLEQWFAFMKQEDLTLGALLERLPIPNRPHAHVPPRLPPYFASLDRERRARMVERCAQPGKLQERVKHGWIPLFTPPPPPSFIPPEKFGKMMHEAVEKRFADTSALVEKFQARGGKIVFVRLPVSGELKELERQRHAATADLGQAARGNRRARDSLRGLSGFGRLRMSRMVAPFGGRFGRIHPAPRSAPPRRPREMRVRLSCSPYRLNIDA